VPEDEVEARAAVAVERAFGEANRRRIIEEYLAEAGEVTSHESWQHVYRLLLWINRTISLAHCYESDKCQPHKSWYARSLAFHAWLSNQFGVDPRELHEDIDRLFRSALPALAFVETTTRNAAAARHLGEYPAGLMPLPGDDADLVDLVVDALGPAVQPERVGLDRGRLVVERVYAHFAQENKRKNLLGRGFEDTLAALVRRLPESAEWDVRTRVPLLDIPGFTPHSAVLHRAEVDLALWERRPSGRRILVSAKWSVRADRERQFDSDFDDYTTANSTGPFEYALITNEFDAARLDAACTKVRGNQYLFTDVVHVQPDGVLIAYGKEAERPIPQRAGVAGGRRKARALLDHLDSRRLISLESWLNKTLLT
jgi:hypothetical protein